MVLYTSSRETETVGVDYDEGPPVPIPNTEVKLVRAEDTWLETALENRFSPTQKDGFFGSCLLLFQIIYCRTAAL